MNITLKITVKVTGTITEVLIRVDQHDVRLTGGSGTVVARANADCILHYWLTGDEGAKMDVTVEQGPGNVRLETQETIPPDFTKAAGHYSFRTV